MKASEVFSDNASKFPGVREEADQYTFLGQYCELYKSILHGNYICMNGHFKTIFMIEIKFPGFDWGSTPKIFYTREEAEKESEYLKTKYSFISQCRGRDTERERRVRVNGSSLYPSFRQTHSTSNRFPSDLPWLQSRWKPQPYFSTLPSSASRVQSKYFIVCIANHRCCLNGKVLLNLLRWLTIQGTIDILL